MQSMVEGAFREGCPMRKPPLRQAAPATSPCRGGLGLPLPFRALHPLVMDSLSLFGLAAVSFTLVCYAMESGSHWWTLGFVLGCVAGSAYGFLQGAWPFGVVEIVWAIVSFRRWLTLRRLQSTKFAEPIA